VGYTHYWYTNLKEEHRPKFVELTKLARIIIDLAKQDGVLIGDVMGEVEDGESITETEIAFNGLGAEAHETFSIEFNYLVELKENFNFCKTNHKPYDTVVVAILCAVKALFADSIIKVSSDGDTKDWEDGTALYERALKLQASTSSSSSRQKTNVSTEALLELLHIPLDLSSKKEIIAGIELIDETYALSSAARSTLTAMCECGPLDDGDVPSKAGRDELLEVAMAAKVVVKGVEGYNAATQKGCWALKLVEALGRD
jgi:hypothetical protein